TDVGYSFNASFQIQRQFDNDFYVMFAYNFLDAKDASSIEAEISSDAYDRNPILGNVNNLEATRSLYGNRHRIIGSLYKTWKYGNWATTVSTFISYAQAGTTDNDNVADYRFTYTYSGDINGDGSAFNDLIYIPTDDELDEMNFAEDAQRSAFRAYIQQDDYLSENRGSYAEKYALVAPWYSQMDIRVLQDLNLQIGERTNKIQLSLDILNVGNLINSYWGVRTLPNNTQPLGVTVDDTGTPTYTFDTNLKDTFSDFTGLISRWQARVGLRYVF
ncbi:MAG: TonB-dependent receptor, partial [Bacteroidota bacterium]